MGRRQSLMDKYRQHMRNLRKSRGKSDNTPYYDDQEVFIMNCVTLDEKIPAKILETEIRNRRAVIKSIECPVCHTPMVWSRTWETFSCKNTEHQGPKRYEVIKDSGLY
ncbi:MAG: hypothetical protein WC974_07110 [Thermoplasmata archaeon]